MLSQQRLDAPLSACRRVVEVFLELPAAPYSIGNYRYMEYLPLEERSSNNMQAK